LEQRDVDGRLRTTAKAAVSRCGCNAHNQARTVCEFGTEVFSQKDLLAERISAGPKLVCHRFVDDRHKLAALIAGHEIPPQLILVRKVSK
jgi:hypothetical protein